MIIGSTAIGYKWAVGQIADGMEFLDASFISFCDLAFQVRRGQAPNR